MEARLYVENLKWGKVTCVRECGFWVVGRRNKVTKKKTGRTRGKEHLNNCGLSVASAIRLLVEHGLEIGFSRDEME
jgi:hypothetical protein